MCAGLFVAVGYVGLLPAFRRVVILVRGPLQPLKTKDFVFIGFIFWDCPNKFGQSGKTKPAYQRVFSGCGICRIRTYDLMSVKHAL